MHLVIRPSHFRRDLSTCVRIEQKDGWAMRSEKNGDSETDTQVDDLAHAGQNRPWIHII